MRLPDRCCHDPCMADAVRPWEVWGLSPGQGDGRLPPSPCSDPSPAAASGAGVPYSADTRLHQERPGPLALSRRRREGRAFQGATAHGGDTRKPTAVVGPAQTQKPDCGGSSLFSDYKPLDSLRKPGDSLPGKLHVNTSNTSAKDSRCSWAPQVHPRLG